MSEKIIRISVKDRYALAEGNPVIICGNSGYSVEFTFDPEWDSYEVKTARFVYVKRGEVEYQDVVFAGTTAVVPILSNIQAVHVGVFADDLSTTTPARIPCRFSVRCGTGAPEDPTPNQYDQIMALLRLSDPENLVRLNQGAEHAGQVLTVGEDGRVVPADPPAGNTETDATLTKSGTAADAKAVGDALAEQGKTIPKVFKWANAELPFTENEISGVVAGGGFGTNHTNFADGKTYFRYHAGPNSFAWTNPNPQKGAVTITVLAWSQYADKTAANTFSALNIVYADGTSGRLQLVNGQTVTMTTDASKVLAQIKGNYDHENWVLLDMDALSIVADYPAPTGGVSGDASINVTASVGQTIVVKEVDENGKPTEWEAADFPTNYRLIKRIILEEETATIDSFTTDEDGNEFNLRDVIIVSGNLTIGESSTASSGVIRVWVSTKGGSGISNSTIFPNNAYVQPNITTNSNAVLFAAVHLFGEGGYFEASAENGSLRERQHLKTTGNYIQMVGFSTGNPSTLTMAAGTIIEVWGADA